MAFCEWLGLFGVKVTSLAEFCLSHSCFLFSGSVSVRLVVLFLFFASLVDLTCKFTKLVFSLGEEFKLKKSEWLVMGVFRFPFFLDPNMKTLFFFSNTFIRMKHAYFLQFCSYCYFRIQF